MEAEMVISAGKLVIEVGKQVKNAIDNIREFRDCMQGKGKVYEQAKQLLEKIEAQLQVIAFLMEKPDRAEKIYGAQLERLNELLTRIVNQLHAMTGTEVGSQLKRFAFKASYLTTLKQFSEQIDSEDTQMLVALNTQELQQLEEIISNMKTVEEKVEDGQQKNQALVDQVQQLIDTIAQIKQEKEEEGAEVYEDVIDIISEKKVKEQISRIYGHENIVDPNASPATVEAAARMAAVVGNIPLPRRHKPSSNSRVSIRLKEGADRMVGVIEGNSFRVTGDSPPAKVQAKAEPQRAEEKREEERGEQQQQARSAQPPAAPQPPREQLPPSPQLPLSGAGRGRGIVAFNMHAEQQRRDFAAQAAAAQQPHQQSVNVDEYLQQQEGRDRLVERVVEEAVQAKSQGPGANR
jgi:hypothetical protein